ncbi:Transferase [Corchorus olitorius]|uniref:Transferase n=1 Tax=Corchorus olitorius TaxID=93759 RepID=A0A1R3GGX8_9ROSI|nr:Transferase [Corchorus olitorius]
MAYSKSVKIVEVSRVTPSPHSPSSAKEFSLPFTFLDTFCFKVPPVQLVYFYKFTASTSDPSYFNLAILPKLKQSLSLALLHYLPLAGNIRWPSAAPKPFLLYTPNDDGVSFTVAESDGLGDFDRLIANHEIHESKDFYALVPELMMSDDIAAILSLQITLFPHQGFSIGYTIHHSVLDGTSVIMFVNSWAYLCKQGNKPNSYSLPPELTPFYDRSCIKDPSGLDLIYLNNWIARSNSDPKTNKSLKIWQNSGVPPDSQARATFELTRQDINKLREKVLSKSDKGKQLHLSTFVISYAYVATCLVKLKGEKCRRKVGLAIPVNYRKRLHPPLPATYLGTCGASHLAFGEATKLMDDNGIVFAAELLSDIVKSLDKEQVVQGTETKLLNLFSIGQDSQVELLSAGGYPKFNFYGADFGWGNPKKVECLLPKAGAFSMFGSSDGSGGVEINLALKKHEMETFAALFINALRRKVPGLTPKL